MTGYGGAIFDQHRELLEASGISVEVARARGYRSVDAKTALGDKGFGKAQQRVPGLLIPWHGTAGGIVTWEYRPDDPRLDAKGKARKYEKPTGSKARLDVHPSMLEALADRTRPLWITEGIRKADAGTTHGLSVIALGGVSAWTTNGGEALTDWHDVPLKGRRVYVAFDSDVTTKPQVQKALRRLVGFLENRGAEARVVVLPEDDGKTGLDDYLAAGHTITDLEALALPAGTLPATRTADPAAALQEGRAPAVPVDPCTLEEVVATYQRWLELPDLVPLYAVLGAYAANLLPGDPVWLLLVGGSGNGKTELLSPLAGLPGVKVVSTLSGEAALLSGSSKKETASDATGGLLREMGDRGVIVLKDFTSILSMKSDSRAPLLGALREVYDGSWTRRIGVDGGRLLTWTGQAGLLGGVTASLDRHHAVVAAMGERYVVCRLPEVDAEIVGARALAHAGHEPEMRADLGRVVRGLLGNGLPSTSRPRTDQDRERLQRLANLTTAARSPVERDYQGEIDLVLDREGPGRFIKALERLWAGCESVGLSTDDAWKVVERIAFDSIPKLRRLVLDALAKGSTPATLTTTEVSDLVAHPSRTTRRALEDLAAHRVVHKLGGGEGKADRWVMAEWAFDRYAGTLPAIPPDRDGDLEEVTPPPTPTSVIAGKVCGRCHASTDRTVPHHATGLELCPACCHLEYPEVG